MVGQRVAKYLLVVDWMGIVILCPFFLVWWLSFCSNQIDEEVMKGTIEFLFIKVAEEEK